MNLLHTFCVRNMRVPTFGGRDRPSSQFCYIFGRRSNTTAADPPLRKCSIGDGNEKGRKGAKAGAKLDLGCMDDDDDDDEGICRARHKYSSDALSISQTGGPSDVERTSEGRELQFAERLVNCSR